MNTNFHRSNLHTALILALFILTGIASSTDTPHRWFAYQSGLGADGYDLVAYFQDQRARKGNRNHAVDYAGQRWLFASQENADTFQQSPEQYLPAYGSHCAFGASRGYLVRGDPQAWTVRNGQLYLNYSKAVRRTWLKSPDRYIKKADRFWARLQQQ
ncbi:MAG: YHS domain-containing (seleno)protein [Gammaproteobacteria bacterium]